MAMNKQVKERWIKALRSGKYKQGQHLLVSNDSDDKKYCCLGVLCQLYATEKKKGISKIKLGVATSSSGDRLPAKQFLPNIVREWAGLDVSDPIVDYDDNSTNRLTHLNDGYELDFNQLADIIEEQL